MRAACSAAVVVLALACAAAQAQVDPASLPAHDSHDGFLVACDPYQDSARAETRFGKKNPLDAGIVPIEIYFRNNSGKAVRVNLDHIRLLVAPPGQERQRLDPMSVEDVVDRMVNKGGPPTLGSPRSRIPHPGPKIGRDKKWKQVEEKLRPLSLEVGVVAPGSTVHGFLFFDLQHRNEFLLYAHLYVPDLNFMEGNQPLMYFEADLAPATKH